MEIRKTVTDAVAFLEELTRAAAGKPVEIHVHITEERKEDALADVRLALNMSYGGGTDAARALTER